MAASSETIMSATTHPGDSTVETVEGSSFKGDGYYGRSDGVHTVQYSISGFTGTIKMQATLATIPTASDWFDVSGTEIVYASTTTTNDYKNFTGNFVWVRAHVVYTDGDINAISLNH